MKTLVGNAFGSLVRWFLQPLTPNYWRRFRDGFAALFSALGWLIRKTVRERSLPRSRSIDNDCCIHLPPSVYKRPDPLIYAQYYLMGQGLAVTWDNPDIEIFDEAGRQVSAPLAADRTYRVRVRVWNGSYDAPAVGLDVELSYLTFGAQTLSHAIARTLINLGVKGGSDCPAFANFTWKTPQEAGHYCLQARLVWSDDANPDNNLGQKNVIVGQAHSPVQFDFVVRNPASVPRRFVFEADDYVLAQPPRCDERSAVGFRLKNRRAESQARWRAAADVHGYGRFSLDERWRIGFTPTIVSLDPGAEAKVQIIVEPLDSELWGKPVNVHIFALDERGGKRLAGGVTLIATRRQGGGA